MLTLFLTSLPKNKCSVCKFTILESTTSHQAIKPSEPIVLNDFLWLDFLTSFSFPGLVGMSRDPRV